MINSLDFGLRTVVILVFVGALLWQLRPAANRDALNRSFVIGALVLMLGWTSINEAVWQFRNYYFSQVAQEVSGRPEVSVRCQRLSQAMVYTEIHWGWVEFVNGEPADYTTIRYESCRDIADYALDPSNPTVNQILAVSVLAHESIHLRGVSDEALTECASMQRFTTAAVALGASPEEATRDQQILHDAGFLRRAANSEYRSSGCVENGPMDETPGDGVFPGGLNDPAAPIPGFDN